MSVTRTVVVNIGQLVTLGEFGGDPQEGPLPSLVTVEDAALLMEGGVVTAAGAADDVLGQLEPGVAPDVVDADGGAVVPGFVDPHTHLLYAGSREDEYPMRLAGRSYLEIAQTGGGIGRTTESTRQATFQDLLLALCARLDRLLANGTTTVEVKTGYGLDRDSELLELEVIRAANRIHPIDVVATFLPAHAVPPEYRQRPDRYVDLIVDEMLEPAAGRADFFDVFCETGYFTPQQSTRMLRAAAEHGFQLRVHADELTDQGAAGIAAEVGAASADHLCCSSRSNIASMAAAGVTAVILPGTRFFFLAERYADVKAMQETGVSIALGSDHSPTSPIESMSFVIGLACSQLRMTAAEALVAATHNAALSLGRPDVGGLSPGRAGDALVLDTTSYEYLPFHMTRPLVRHVIKNGRLVHSAKAVH